MTSEEPNPEVQADATRIEAELPLAEERVSFGKRTVGTSRVRVRTVIDEREHWLRQYLAREEVHIDRVAVDREVQTCPSIQQRGDTLVIPVVEEVLVVEKRLVLKEELHVRTQRHVDFVEHPVTVKSMHAEIERLPAQEGDEQSGSSSTRA